MTKALLPFAFIGILSLSACEKDEVTTPQADQSSLSIKIKDATIDCHCGGGSWDIADSEEGASAARMTTTVDTVVTKSKVKGRK